jgi:hypothetical protein
MKRLQSFSAGRRSGIPCSDSIAIFTGTDEHCATVCVASRRAEGQTPAYDAAYRRRAVLQGQVASVSCFRPVPSCYLSRAGRLAGAMSSPVSCVHPVACGEASAPGCTRPPVFFLLFTGKYREGALEDQIAHLRFGQFRLDHAPSLLQGFHLCFRGGDDVLRERRKQRLKSLVSVDRKHPVVFPVVPEH